MRKIITLSVVAMLFATATATNTGCSKTSTPNIPNISLPDVSNLLVQASTTFVKGAQALISIASSTLGNGTFTVNYSLSGNNTGSGTATLTMSGGTGTFNTSTLSSDGPTTVTVTSITNSAGGSASLTSHNTSSLFDSSGLMIATYTPHGGSPTSFRATDVSASLAGTLLNIEGVVWEPNLTTINLYEDYYSGTTGVVSFDVNDLTAFPRDAYSSFNGSAHYSGVGTAQICSHGTITISTISPLLTGSFTYTNPDSSVVAGTFSCKAP